MSRNSIRAGGVAAAGLGLQLNLGLALLADPEVLLLDEPHAGFDWDTYLRFWQLVAQRRDAGRSVLIISHFVADEQRFDRIVHLRDGRTVPRGRRSCSSTGSWPTTPATRSTRWCSC